MSEIFPETPITSLPGAVAFLGALPMKVGTEPQPLSAERLAGIAEYTKGAARLAPRAWMGIGRELLAEIGRLEHTVQQMVEGLNGHDCPPPNEAPLETVTRWRGYLDTAEARVAELEAERAGQGVGCSCPPADHPHQVGCLLDVPAPGSPERPVNELTAAFMPVPSLRASLEDPHDGPLAHSYRVPHDLPVPESCRLDADGLDEVSRRFIGGSA